MPTPATELTALQSTVTELAGQMAWFVQRLAEDDVVITAFSRTFFSAISDNLDAFTGSESGNTKDKG